LLRNAQKRDKKNRTRQPREGKRKTEEKPPTFLVMNPDPRCFFWDEKKSLFRDFEPLLLRNAEKRDKKNQGKNRGGGEVSNYSFLGLRQMYVTFVIYFFTAPLE
jgi:hypothetical protein